MQAGESSCVSIADNYVHLQDPHDANPKDEKYLFDKAFAMDADQERVYTKTASDLVKYALDGFNGTMFAYGQTSSGKTFTMDGEPNNARRNPGVMRRAFQVPNQNSSNF